MEIGPSSLKVQSSSQIIYLKLKKITSNKAFGVKLLRNPKTWSTMHIASEELLTLTQTNVILKKYWKIKQKLRTYSVR